MIDTHTQTHTHIHTHTHTHTHRYTNIISLYADPELHETWERYCVLSLSLSLSLFLSPLFFSRSSSCGREVSLSPPLSLLLSLSLFVYMHAHRNTCYVQPKVNTPIYTHHTYTFRYKLKQAALVISCMSTRLKTNVRLCEYLSGSHVPVVVVCQKNSEVLQSHTQADTHTHIFFLSVYLCLHVRMCA